MGRARSWLGALARAARVPAGRRRLAEVRAGWQARDANARHRSSLPADEPPLPPGRLMHRVAGTADIGWFRESGARAAECIRAASAAAGQPIEHARAVLDFGCGCGRVIRHWRALPGRVAGTDLSAGAVRWCRGHLTFAEFAVNRLDPPLAYGAGAFDLAYALSVFTHLDAARQGSWIAELRRVLRPGGLLVLSTHGRRYAADLPPAQAERFLSGELVVTGTAEEGSNVCSAYHPESYVRAVLSAGWEIVAFTPEGALGNPHQDLWVLRLPLGG